MFEQRNIFSLKLTNKIAPYLWTMQKNCARPTVIFHSNSFLLTEKNIPDLIDFYPATSFFPLKRNPQEFEFLLLSRKSSHSFRDLPGLKNHRQ